MYRCVYVYIHMHIFIYPCMYMHIYVYVYMILHVDVYVYVYMHMHVSTYMYIYTYTHVWIWGSTLCRKEPDAQSGRGIPPQAPTASNPNLDMKLSSRKAYLGTVFAKSRLQPIYEFLEGVQFRAQGALGPPRFGPIPSRPGAMDPRA